MLMEVLAAMLPPAVGTLNQGIWTGRIADDC